MADKKKVAKKSNAKNKEEAIDVKLEEVITPRANISLFMRLLITLTFAGISLMVYDRVEPGKVPFFYYEEEKQECANPVYDVADQVNEVLSEFSGQVKAIIADRQPAPAVETKFNFDEVVNNINSSKDEIIGSFSEYLSSFKKLKIEADKVADKKEVEKVITEARQDAAEDSKNELVVNIIIDKVSSLLSRKESVDSQKESLFQGLMEAKSEILKPVTVSSADDENKTDDDITNKIKGALRKYVKVKKIDDERIMLEQLFMEAEELLEQEEFDALTNVLTEIEGISGNKQVSVLILKSKGMEEFEDRNIKENLKEILSLVEKMKS